MSGGREKDMLTFLQEAELEHYYTAISRDLHVSSVTQIKYVEDDDLLDIGMSRPEMRRLRKFYNKACPKGFGKLRKILSTKAGNDSTSPDASSYPRSPQISRSLAESSPLIPPDAVTAYKTLGDGEFAIVQQGIWTRSNGERLQVALKCIRLDRMETPMSQFAKEAKELMSADHDHILPIYGVVCGVNSLSMVMELAPLRSLLECLKEPSLRNTFHVVQLCQFSCQIADGMRYLESRKIVHRDLAARNVLVFAKDKVKVSDASLTQALGIGPEYYQSNININLKLPIAWCAPECIHEQKFTCASDVWAYGVTLWEMFSYGFQPWAAFTGDQVLEAIDEPSCHRLEQPDACPSNYYNLMMQCWSHSVDLRPKFSVILSRLHEMQPERVQAMRDGSGLLKPDQLILRAQDIITVLDKQAPELGMWKGVMENGKVGYFESSMVAPFVELRNGSPAHRTKSAKVTRKESARKSMQKGGVKKLSASMISGPKNDLRHTGHIGYDGAVFGDVSFIGNNYDKLPVKVGATHNPLDEMSGSTISLPVTEKDRASVVASAQARLSYISVQSRTDVDSVVSRLSDSDTLTDVSSMVDDMDGLQRCKSEEQVLDRTYTDITTEDFGDEDFGDFKLPDLSTDMGFDLGPSFMDEVMKALDTGKPEPSLARPVEAEVTPAAASRRKDSPNGISNSNHHGLTSEKSPLIVAASPDHCVSASTFDNIALASEDFDSVEEDSVSSSRGSCASQLKDSGIMESSFGSLEISDYSKLSEDSPFKEEEKKRSSRPKLKLIMPSRGESSKKEGIQPMSASDEKLLNDAIDLANEYDQLHNADNMSPIVQPDDHTLERLGASPTSAEPDRLDSSWTSSKFGLRKKSPREERRSFTDEMASRPVDMNEELTPEAQEAYNMLVVKGTSKERDSFKAIRERRMNRAMFPSSSSTDTDVNSALGARNGRASNLNIRKPQGIPTRGVGLRTASENSPEVQDTNPLRRLRESQSASTKPRSLSSHSELVNGQQAAGVSSVLHHPNLNPNMSFFDKLKEQEMANGDQPQQPLQQQQQQEGTSNVPSNPLPVPPRVPLRTSTVNAKPRERKHMLDLGSPKVVELSGPSALEHVSVTTVSGVVGTRSSGLSTSTEARRTHREGDDNVFTESKSCFVFPGAQELSPVSPLERPFSLSSNDSQLSINVKSVTASAHDLGIDDHSDSFWLQKINFEELVAHDFDPAMVEDENAPIPGRYKTSDTVSYEDLMEFALDGPHPRDTDFSTICDEVRLMRRILSKDVRLEDCMCALEETGWDVHSAIKLLKLKQLLSLGLGDQDWCKTALMRSKWSINEAANYLLTNLSGSDSPDLIHV